MNISIGTAIATTYELLPPPSLLFIIVGFDVFFSDFVFWNQGCALEPPYKKADTGPYFYNLTADQTESKDLTKSMASLYAKMNAEFHQWQTSVTNSSVINRCGKHPKPPTPTPTPGAPTPSPGPVGANCTFMEGIGGFGGDKHIISGLTLQECCDACRRKPACTVAVFKERSTPKDKSACHIKDETKVGYAKKGYWACRARNQTEPLTEPLE
jgi:hypothetical protein